MVAASLSVGSRPRAASLTMLVLAFAAVYVIWGSTYLGIKLAIQTLPPLLMAGIRFLLAGGLLYAWRRIRGDPQPTAAHWRSAFIIGGFLLLGGNGLICLAQQRVPSSLAALLVATTPLWMTLLEWLFLGGRRPTPFVFVGLALGLTGVAVLINPGPSAERTVPIWGLAMVLTACVSWSIGSLWSRRIALPGSLLMGTGMQMIGGGSLLLIAGSIHGEWTAVDLQAVSLSSMLAFWYLVIFGSLIGFTAYIWLLKHVSAPAVSTYAFVNPMVAVLLGWLFADEKLGFDTLIAASLIVAAVVLITLRRTAAAKPAEAASAGIQERSADVERPASRVAPRELCDVGCAGERHQ